MTSKSTPSPFKIIVTEDVINDIKNRLSLTRWPDEIPESHWKYGASLKYLKELIHYWKTEYDWRTHERRLNNFDQFKVKINDVDLHYIYIPGKGPNPMPLLLSHGWPGSIYEFIRIIGPLTDPSSYGGNSKDAFSIVAPSLPGYGFSQLHNNTRLGLKEIAKVFVTLMTDVLGFSNFGAQGGDWGALITSYLGFQYPDRVLCIHLNMIGAFPAQEDMKDLSASELEFLKKAGSIQDEIGYQWIQGTRPQTLAYGLNDSPTGLAAWITEKFYAWTDCHGDIEKSVSKDDLLSNIMIYWVTQTINSSFWLYYWYRHEPWNLKPGERIKVPTGFAAFPGEIITPPKEWVERVYNLKRYTPMEAGGHFAALEKPQELVTDIRDFFRELR